MSQDNDPLARGLEEAYGQRSVLDILAQKSGLDTRISVAPDMGGPMVKPLAAGARASAGKYQFQGEIARGGVGAILKGYDTHLGRDVAIKLLREDFLADPDLLHRFVEEAQIGGQLQHPGVVPVYDLGLQDRRPFFSMKLVKGRTLSALLDERKGPLDQRRRFLAIFEQVCLTMAYAHARGVIHRDLKPSNVMVGAYGEVQVLDWGMGKVLGFREETPKPDLSVIATVRSDAPGSQSVVGSVMGTPAYMPPEQALGDVDRMNERSDVFALGALLCQILTGAPPYTGKGLIEQAAQADLAKCHERIDACDAEEDLKQLVRQCLAPARLARPKDAGEIAQRIGSYLAAVDERTQKAVVAAAEQRAKAKAARRKQKLTLGLAASVLALLTLGGGGLWWVRADRAERTEQQRRTVQAALNEARVASGRDDWDAALSAAKRAHALAKSEETASYLAEVQGEHKAARDLADRLARERKTLAKLEGIPIPPKPDSSPLDEANARRRDREYRRVLGNPEKLVLRDVAEPEQWAAALDDWALALLVLGGPDRAHLVEIAKAIDPEPVRAKLRDLLLGDWVEAVDVRPLADATGDLPPMTALTLAALLVNRGESNLAWTVMRSAHDRYPDHYLLALRAAHAMLHNHPVEALRYASVAASLRPDSTTAWYVQARALADLKRGEEAVPAYQRAIELDAEFGSAYHDLAHALEDLGRFEEALEPLETAVRLEPNFHICLARAYHRLGRHEEGRKERLAWQRLQQRIAEEALATAQESVRRQPASARAQAMLGQRFRALGQTKEALAPQIKARDLNPESADHRVNLGVTLRELERYDEAFIEFQEALRLDPGRTFAHHYLARISERRGDLDKALEHWRKAESPLNLGQFLERMNRLDEALDAYRDAVRHHPKFPVPLQQVGRVLWKQGKRDEAIAAYREGVKRFPKHEPGYLELASRLIEYGRPEEAVEVCRDGVARIPSARLWDSLGYSYLRAGKPDKAIAPWSKTLELDPDHPTARYNGACAAALSGDKQLALTWLRELLPTRTKKQLEHWLEDGDLDSLRDDKAFWAEVRKALEEAK